MNHKHHNHCEHNDVSYCRSCDKTYCKSCNKEWGNSYSNWTYAQPYWITNSTNVTGNGAQRVTTNTHSHL